VTWKKRNQLGKRIFALSSTSSVKVVAIVPAFNEERTIGQVVQDLLVQVDEVIVVDDCSEDRTGDIARGAGATVISHDRNQGYSAAINRGFQAAALRGVDVVCTFDADGQHCAEDIPTLLDPIRAGEVDFTVGVRSERVSVGEVLFSWYSRIRYGILDPLCGLKAYRMCIYTDVGHFDTLQSIGTELMVEALHRGYRVAQVPILIRERADESRFYAQKLRANMRIIGAIVRIIWKLELLRVIRKIV